MWYLQNIANLLWLLNNAPVYVWSPHITRLYTCRRFKTSQISALTSSRHCIPAIGSTYHKTSVMISPHPCIPPWSLHSITKHPGITSSCHCDLPSTLKILSGHHKKRGYFITSLICNIDMHKASNFLSYSTTKYWCTVSIMLQYSHRDTFYSHLAQLTL